MASPFRDAVGAVLAGLEPGHVMTYGEVAAEAGRPGAARAVGRALKALPDVPWWRVVNAAGRVCPSRIAEASRRLEREGVPVRAGHVSVRR